MRKDQIVDIQTLNHSIAAILRQTARCPDSLDVLQLCTGVHRSHASRLIQTSQPRQQSQTKASRANPATRSGSHERISPPFYRRKSIDRCCFLFTVERRQKEMVFIPNPAPKTQYAVSSTIRHNGGSHKVGAFLPDRALVEEENRERDDNGESRTYGTDSVASLLFVSKQCGHDLPLMERRQRDLAEEDIRLWSLTERHGSYVSVTFAHITVSCYIHTTVSEKMHACEAKHDRQ